MATTKVARTQTHGKAKSAGDQSSSSACKAQSCISPAAVSLDVATSRVEYLYAPPEAVFQTALKLLASHVPVDPATIKASLDTQHQAARDQPVLVRVVQERYYCGSNNDQIPTKYIEEACRGRTVVRKLTIGGEPYTMVDDELKHYDPSRADPLWYSLRQFEADAAALHVGLDNATLAFDMRWPFHMPRMTAQLKVTNCDSCFAVFFIGAGNPVGALSDVVYLEVLD